jgi:dTMP kinase
MPLFITFEGGEGCGKSTQTRALQNKFKSAAIPSILLREPGGTIPGERIRRLLKQSNGIQISALTELILFNASRSQLVSDVIKPALKTGKVVICDRFYDSTVAYQYYGRGLDLQIVEQMNQLAAQGLKPDLTFLLDISPEIGLGRKMTGANDRFEQEQVAFHHRVREGFLEMAGRESQRWVVIDSMLPRAEITATIWKIVSERIRIV